MVGVRRQARQLEGGDDALVAVAELPVRTDQPLLDHRADDAEALQHVERGRMKGGGPQIARQIVAGFHERNRDAFISQQVGGDEAHGPRTDDNHVLPRLTSHGTPCSADPEDRVAALESMHDVIVARPAPDARGWRRTIPVRAPECPPPSPLRQSSCGRSGTPPRPAPWSGRREECRAPKARRHLRRLDHVGYRGPKLVHDVFRRSVRHQKAVPGRKRQSPAWSPKRSGCPARSAPAVRCRPPGA